MSTTVVALDQSHGAAQALEWAMTHCDADTRFVLVTVLPAARTGQGYPEPHRSEWEQAESFLAKILGDAQERLENDDIKAECEVLSGSPAGEVLDAVRRHHADQLVLGARGEGGFARLMIGSVASAAVHHAPCPVTIVPVPGDRS